MMSTKDMSTNVRLTKQLWRCKINKKLKTQKEEDRNRKSCLIQKKLFRTNLFKKAKVVMFFISFGGEVHTKTMIEKARKLGKLVVVPVCRANRTIRPAIFSQGSRLTSGLYEIWEPAIKNFVRLEDLDLVVVPAVAMDKKGNRLGRGKGYYDHFLAKLSPRTSSIGLAFDFQILPSIPTTNEDKRVDKVIFA